MAIRHFVKARTDQLFKDAIAGLIDDLGQKIPFFYGYTTSSQCPNCIFDPTTQASSGVYNNNGPQPFNGSVCPVCNGNGTVNTETEVQIPRAIVRWGTIGDRQGDFPLPEGDIPQQFGKARVMLNYYNQLVQAEWFRVDGYRCKPIGHPQKRGLRTQAVVEVTFQRDD